MSLLTRDAILKARDISTKDVEVPEWGGTVRVRQMTVAERDEFAKRAKDDANAESTGMWIVLRLVVDESGVPLFRPEDVEELKKRSFKAFDRLTDAVLSVNGVGKTEVEAAAKNS